jgi:hypothetical protein
LFSVIDHGPRSSRPTTNLSTLASPDPSCWWRDRDGMFRFCFRFSNFVVHAHVNHSRSIFPCAPGLWMTDRRFMHDSRLELCSSTASHSDVIGRYFRSQCLPFVSCMQSIFGGPLRNLLHFLTCHCIRRPKVRNLYLKSSLFPSSARSFSLSQY